MASRDIFFQIVAKGRVMLVAPLCQVLWGFGGKSYKQGLLEVVKVNQSHYRPEVPRCFQEVKVPRLRDYSGRMISRKKICCKVVIN